MPQAPVGDQGSARKLKKRKHKNTNSDPDQEQNQPANIQATRAKRPKKKNPGLHVSPESLSRLRQIVDPVTFLLIKAIASKSRPLPVCITAVTKLSAVCTAFGLVHPSLPSSIHNRYGDFPAPLVAAPPPLPELLSWEVTDERIEDWLVNRLPDIPIRARLAEVLSPGATLPRFSYLYQNIVARSTEASCRPMVDIILMTAISILNGVESNYQQFFVPPVTSTTTTPSSIPSQQRNSKPTPNKYRGLKLHYEVTLEYTDEGIDMTAGTTYHGRIDWSIGINSHAQPLYSPAPEAGYRSILAVIEAKVPDSLSRASSQVLAYMGCLLRTREKYGNRTDLSTYGVATDGYNWQFFRITPTSKPWEPGTQPLTPSASKVPSKARHLAQIQQTPAYDILKRHHLSSVLCHIMYIIVKSTETLMPTAFPKKSGVAAIPRAPAIDHDDGLVLHTRTAPDVEIQLQGLMEAEVDVLEERRNGGIMMAG